MVVGVLQRHGDVRACSPRPDTPRRDGTSISPSGRNRHRLQFALTAERIAGRQVRSPIVEMKHKRRECKEGASVEVSLDIARVAVQATRGLGRDG